MQNTTGHQPHTCPSCGADALIEWLPEETEDGIGYVKCDECGFAETDED